MPKGQKFGGRDWKKGQSGNPKGRMKMPAELKNRPPLSSQYFRYILNKYANMTVEKLKEAYTNPNTPALDLWVLSVMVKGIEQGDQARFGFLLDRMIGKVKEQVQVEVKPVIEFSTNIQLDGSLVQEVIEGEVEQQYSDSASEDQSTEATQ